MLKTFQLEQLQFGEDDPPRPQDLILIQVCEIKGAFTWYCVY